ncbi:MAG: ABC transporter permease subunit [Thermoplasmatota archaeon]
MPAPSAANRRLAILVVALAVMGLALVVYESSRAAPVSTAGHPAPPFSLLELPYLAFRSMLRMVIAFALALVFSFLYGWAAATSKVAARFLLPVLDILQSVPVLGFFPAAILFFVQLSNGGSLGLEAASVFLVFTAQAWNMTFAVYEALLGIPADTKDAAEVVGLQGWARVRRLLWPACVPKIIYNGVVSWAAGWYFVTASEVISANGSSYPPNALPGLGSFLTWEAGQADVGALLWGLLTLGALVVAVEFLVWRPLYSYAEKFRFDAIAPTEHRKSRVLELYRTAFGAGAVKPSSEAAKPATDAKAFVPRKRARNERLARAWHIVAGSVGLGVLTLVAALLTLAVLSALHASQTPDTIAIPVALALSTLRLLAAFIITLLWTIPVAIWTARNERAARWIMPTTEVLASVPAVALFPAIVLVLVGVTGGLAIPSILLVLTGMQWYVLFNLISGARAIPADLLAAAQLSGLKGWLLWKRVYLPAMAPALVTGSITAWGGGWNALIVSEYVQFNGHTFFAFGIGYLIDKATIGAASTSSTLFILSLAGLIAYIYILNLVFWKPVYNRVLKKYKMEG